MEASGRVLVNGVLGTIRYIGPTSFASGTWFGVELDESKGNNDGSIYGKRYFDCKPGFGALVRETQIQPYFENEYTESLYIDREIALEESKIYKLELKETKSRLELLEVENQLLKSTKNSELVNENIKLRQALLKCHKLFNLLECDQDYKGLEEISTIISKKDNEINDLKLQIQALASSEKIVTSLSAKNMQQSDKIKQLEQEITQYNTLMELNELIDIQRQENEQILITEINEKANEINALKSKLSEIESNILDYHRVFEKVNQPKDERVEQKVVTSFLSEQNLAIKTIDNQILLKELQILKKKLCTTQNYLPDQFSKDIECINLLLKVESLLFKIDLVFKSSNLKEMIECKKILSSLYLYYSVPLNFLNITSIGPALTGFEIEIDQMIESIKSSTKPTHFNIKPLKDAAKDMEYSWQSLLESACFCATMQKDDNLKVNIQKLANILKNYWECDCQPEIYAALQELERNCNLDTLNALESLISPKKFTKTVWNPTQDRVLVCKEMFNSHQDQQSMIESLKSQKQTLMLKNRALQDQIEQFDLKTANQNARNNELEKFKVQITHKDQVISELKSEIARIQDELNQKPVITSREPVIIEQITEKVVNECSPTTFKVVQLLKRENLMLKRKRFASLLSDLSSELQIPVQNDISLVRIAKRRLRQELICN